MNILLIIPCNTGTIASVSHNLYLGLRKQAGVKVYTACLGEYEDSGYQFEDIFKLGQGKQGILSKLKSRIFKLRKIKKENNVHLSIATLWGCIYWDVLSSFKEKKIGVFHTRLSQMRYQGLIYYWLHLLANMFLIPRLDKMIAVNKSAFLDLKHRHKKAHHIELVYNIHNFEKIQHLASIVIENNAERELFQGHVILYVGNLYYHLKGTDRLIKAFAKVVKIHPDYKLVIIGGDPDGSLVKLKKAANQFGASNSIFFLGRKNNPYQYMKLAEMLVSPSRDEGLPGVIIESLSLDTKVVATNSSIGVWEIMQCDERFDDNLNEVQETEFGFITPNKLDDDDATVNFLAQGIDRCIGKTFNIREKFDKNRFSEDCIITHFIL